MIAVIIGQNAAKTREYIDDLYRYIERLPDFSDIELLIQRNWQRCIWILMYWRNDMKLIISQIAHRMKSFYRKILRCNRKGIGLRIKVS